MIGSRLPLIGLTILLGLCFVPTSVWGQEPAWRSELTRTDGSANRISNLQNRFLLPVPVEAIPKTYRETIFKVMQQPTITAMAGPDRFPVNSQLYDWLLDHPDRVGFAWRRIGVPAIEIKPLKNGQFLWQDDQGSEMVWQTVAKSEEGRIWYAEGKVKPGALMPLTPVKAVAVMHYEVLQDRQGKMNIRHQVETYLQTDSKFAAMITKLLGNAAPKMAEQGAEQLLYFFAGISKHLDANPDKAPKLLAEWKK